jgi:hypothetical protein
MLVDIQVYIETDPLFLRSWVEDVSQYIAVHNAHQPDKIKLMIENASQSLTKLEGKIECKVATPKT